MTPEKIQQLNDIISPVFPLDCTGFTRETHSVNIGMGCRRLIAEDLSEQRQDEIMALIQECVDKVIKDRDNYIHEPNPEIMAQLRVFHQLIKD